MYNDGRGSLRRMSAVWIRIRVYYGRAKRGLVVHYSLVVYGIRMYLSLNLSLSLSLYIYIYICMVSVLVWLVLFSGILYVQRTS